MGEKFTTFMRKREAAARAFVNGDAEPVAALSIDAGQATFFDPGGGFTEGASEVNRVNREGAKSFGPESSTQLEVHDRDESGDLAFWVGYQSAEVELRGKGKKVPMRIRVTEIFRRVGEDWKMIHRHASMAKEE
jgi:ketosteroid isomerase-like protein